MRGTVDRQYRARGVRHRSRPALPTISARGRRPGQPRRRTRPWPVHSPGNRRRSWRYPYRSPDTRRRAPGRGDVSRSRHHTEPLLESAADLADLVGPDLLRVDGPELDDQIILGRQAVEGAGALVDGNDPAGAVRVREVVRDRPSGQPEHRTAA